MNSVVVSGYVVNDVEIKRSESGTGYIRNQVRVVQVSKQGKNIYTYCNIQLVGVEAEKFFKYCKKNTYVICRGRLKVDRWENNGAFKYSTNIAVDDFEVIKSSRSEDEKPNKETTTNEMFGDIPTMDLDGLSDDEIPF